MGTAPCCSRSWVRIQRDGNVDPRRLARRLSLKSDAALAFDAGLFDRVHLAVRQREIVRLLLVDAVSLLRPDDHDR